MASRLSEPSGIVGLVGLLCLPGTRERFGSHTPRLGGTAPGHRSAPPQVHGFALGRGGSRLASAGHSVGACDTRADFRSPVMRQLLLSSYPVSPGPLRSSRIGSRHRCDCRGKAGRIVRGPARATTLLRPCGDPRLGGAVTSNLMDENIPLPVDLPAAELK